MRRRAVHFVAIGFAAFVASASLAPRSAPAPVLLDPQQADRLRREWTARTGAPPTAAQWQALVGDALDEEALYRSALSLGLVDADPVVQSRLASNARFLDGDGAGDATVSAAALPRDFGRSDLVVRRRLVERMRERLRAADAVEPSEAALRAYLDAHRERFRVPPRIALVQVFLSRQRRAAALEADARALRERLTAADVARARALGDPLPVAVPPGPTAEHDLARLLGPELARRAMRLPPGRWSAPLASPYGLHLVWVVEQVPAIDPPLPAVRAQVRAAVREERAEAALRDGMAALRAAYGIPAAPRTDH